MNYQMPHFRVLQEGPYSYALEANYHFTQELEVPGIQTHEFLDASGQAVVAHKGYAWDGPSGPVFHTISWVRGSLVHDIYYQMMRLGWLPRSFRSRADAIMYDLVREDGMPWWRAWYSWAAVRLFGWRYVR